jgi:hypothetical protein
MTDLRKAAEMALESLEDFGSDSIALKLKARMALRQALAQPVDAVNISQERVDETAKRNCDNCESLRKAAWDRINELEAKLAERENNALFNDVLKSFKLYAESLGIKLKEKNGG